MKRMRWILVGLMCTGSWLPAVAESGRYPITTSQVADALSQMGMEVSPRQVTLLSDVVAGEQAPVLKVQSISMRADHRATVRVACSSTRECLPFMAELHLDGAGGQFEGRGDAAAPVPAAAAPAPAAAARISEPVESAPAERVPAGPVVRWGSKAVLLIVAPHMQIRIPVICMQNGSVGQTIRVTSPDHHESYSAEVISRGFLRGTL